MFLQTKTRTTRSTSKRQSKKIHHPPSPVAQLLSRRLRTPRVRAREAVGTKLPPPATLAKMKKQELFILAAACCISPSSKESASQLAHSILGCYQEKHNTGRA
eukprot:3535950-Rhodomonas_salina.1